MLRFLAFAVTAAAAVGGCYNPSFKDGISCGANHACPSGQACGDDSRCHPPGSVDAPPIAPVPDAASSDAVLSDAPLLDAAPLGCQRDADCSDLDDECNDGVCDLQAGCVKRAARTGIDCGPGSTCLPFGACDYTSVCDSSASQSRSCSDNKCQAGTCTRTDRVELLPCSRMTEGTLCGDRTFNGCGACSGSTQEGCAGDGTQTCASCADMRCKDNACQPTPPFVCDHNCAELREGEQCALDPDSCLLGDLKICCASGSCVRQCGCIR
jgi:hypothetical protein